LATASVYKMDPNQNNTAGNGLVPQSNPVASDMVLPNTQPAPVADLNSGSYDASLTAQSPSATAAPSLEPNSAQMPQFGSTSAATQPAANSSIPTLEISPESALPQYNQAAFNPASTTSSMLDDSLSEGGSNIGYDGQNAQVPTTSTDGFTPLGSNPELTPPLQGDNSGAIGLSGSSPVSFGAESGGEPGVMLRKILIALGGFLGLFLLGFLIWFFLFRNSVNIPVISKSTPINVEENGVAYSLSVPDQSTEDAVTAVDGTTSSYAYKKTDEKGGTEFTGQAFVKKLSDMSLNSSDINSASDIYGTDQITNLVGDIEQAYGLNEVQLGFFTNYTSENISDGVSADITGTGSGGTPYSGRIVSTYDKQNAYSYVMLSPTDNWTENITPINTIFSSFKVDSPVANPISDNGDDSTENNEVDLYTQLSEILPPSSSGVAVGDILEYKIIVQNDGPSVLPADSAKVEFAASTASADLDNSDIEIVAITDVANRFICDKAVGELITDSSPVSCEIKDNLAANNSFSINIQYKHSAAIAGTISPRTELSRVSSSTAAWQDSEVTQDVLSVKTYTASSSSDTAQNPNINNTNNTTQNDTSNDTQNDTTSNNSDNSDQSTTTDQKSADSSLPDTAGFSDESLYWPLTVLVLTTVSIVMSNRRIQKLLNLR